MLATLTTRRLDQRSAVAVAVPTWKADVRPDLGVTMIEITEVLR